MTPAKMTAHVRESLLLVCEKDWPDAEKCAYAAECLVTVGVERQEAYRAAQEVWNKHFRTWEAN